MLIKVGDRWINPDKVCVVAATAYQGPLGPETNLTFEGGLMVRVLGAPEELVQRINKARLR